MSNGYDPNQPRVPKGNRKGGQWTIAGSAARRAAGLDQKKDEIDEEIDQFKEDLSNSPWAKPDIQKAGFTNFEDWYNSLNFYEISDYYYNVYGYDMEQDMHQRMAEKFKKEYDIDKIINNARSSAGLAGTEQRKDLLSPNGFNDNTLKNATLVDSIDTEYGAFKSSDYLLEDGVTRVKVKPNVGFMDYENMSKKEELAYLVDQKLGINLVPETWYQESEQQSIQLYHQNSIEGLSTRRGETKFGNDGIEDLGNMTLLDLTIGNTDRHFGNFLITNGENPRLVAIDNGMSFGYGYLIETMDEIRERADEIYDAFDLGTGRYAISKNVAMNWWKMYDEARKGNHSWLTKGLDTHETNLYLKRMDLVAINFDKWFIYD